MVNTRVAETDVALRVFGPNTDVVIDRKREIEVIYHHLVDSQRRSLVYARYECDAF